MTKIIQTISEWRLLRNSEPLKNKIIGFVPTMGALHTGHQSLLHRCRQENEIAVLSIFINPTQFDDPSDLNRYPQTLEADLAIAQAEKIDYVFLPQANEIYADAYRYKLSENVLSKKLCGQHRPGHFDGVLTVVLKLLHLIKPQRAYFGEKDYQQYLLIKGMVDAFFLDCDIIPCPTLRDSDGLALSSRNKHLNAEERNLAAKFPMLLAMNIASEEVAEQLALAGFNVDYIEDFQQRRFGAVRIGKVRLIDNVKK